MIVYTGGTFDLFHRGHVNLLTSCMKFGKVWIGLNSDEFVTHYKGAPPIMSYDERYSILMSLKQVAGIVKHDNCESSIPTIEMVKPDLIVVGDDWAQKDYYAQMGFTQDWLDFNNITLCYVPYTKGISTTELKRKILLNDSSINANKK